MRLALFSAFAAMAAAQSPGNGISKSTYSCDDPITGWKFLMKYFPVATAPDECANNICSCPATSTQPAWQIQQGRVYTKSSAEENPSPGSGFGMHLVNVSAHVQTGGKTTAEVEAIFATKLGDMSAFDSFMDYNIAHYTKDLSGYTKAFDADKVHYFPASFTVNGSTWHSVFVQVPKSNMILELISDQKSPAFLTSRDSSKPLTELEARLTDRAIDQIMTDKANGLYDSSTGSVLSPLVVNRAASADIWDKLKTFYVTGMKTTQTKDVKGTDMSKMCFLWTGAKVDVCFTKRADSATKGDFKVGDFSTMLNKVHATVLKNPDCGNDKWEDNHYAIDNHPGKTTTSADYIIEYIDANPDLFYYCASDSKQIHYVFDPTGWGIQLDLQFTKGPKGCVGSGDDDELQSRPSWRSATWYQPAGGGNPACAIGNCTAP